LERQERREMGRKSEREEADGDLGMGIMTALFHWGGKKEQWRELELRRRMRLRLSMVVALRFRRR
jgi:hypothetical protein